MRIKRPDYDHAVNIIDDTYHPRFVKGDFVVINPVGQPKNQEFCIAYTSDVTLLGYLQDTELLHPVTDQPQTIPEGAIIHPVAYVVPAKRVPHV